VSAQAIAGAGGEPPESNGHAHPGVSSLVIVRVEDSIDPRLTGRTGGVYQSPPQSPEQAMELVRLLLGWPSGHPDGHARWTTAVAGGRRTVTVEKV
jgi:hypothetical protein